MHDTVRARWMSVGGAYGGSWAAVLCGLGLSVALATGVVAQESRGATSSPEIEAGKQVYTRKCSQCHGDDGKGTGPAADVVFPKPRDFTRGVYKIRSTPSGAVPTDDDLFHTVSNGLPGTSMPAWSVLSERERRQVVQYLKTFSEKFQESPPTPITIPAEVPSSAESIGRGKDLYRDAECWQCHGDAGRGDGPSLPTLKDDWDHPILPANLTKCWNFRGGSARHDIFRAFMTGLNGTPMPSFADIFEPQQAWDLTNYVHSLCRDRTVDIVVKGTAVHGDLPTDINDPRWANASAIDFPLVGQVTQDPREFTPTIDAVTVRALHNDTEVALLLSWDDRTHNQANPAENVYNDAFVVQWPVHLVGGPEKPYFLYGDTARPVYLWHWSADTAGLSESNATGFGTESPQRQESQSLNGAVTYDHGQYTMLVRRTLATDDQDNDLQFVEGRFIPIAFSAWDGSNGETGNKRAVSAWYFLYLEPTPSRARLLYPGIAVVAIAAAELFFGRQGRRRQSV